MKHFLIELLIGILAPHGQENVTANELVHHFAISAQTAEDDILLIVELNHHVLGLPVDVPGLHGAESPGLEMVTLRQRHPHDLVGGHAQKFVSLFAVESDHEEGDTVVRQGLPGLDEVHLGFKKVQIFDVGVRFQDLLTELN